MLLRTLIGLILLLPLTSQAQRGLVASYPFNGNANDISGNGNHGILGGEVENPKLTEDRFGKPNSAYLFGGYYNKNWIRIPNSTSLQFSKSLSISLWLKQCSFAGMDGWGKYSPNGHFILISKSGDGIEANPGIWCNSIISTSNKLNIGFNNVNNKTTNFSENASVGCIDACEWVHCVIVVDNIEWKLYFNGKLRKKAKINSLDFTSANEEDFYIGRMFGGRVIWYPFNGIIDDVSIYNTALIQSEISQLFSNYKDQMYTAHHVTVDTTVCQNTPYLLPSGIFTTTPGIYTDTLTSAQECDSIISTKLSFTPEIRATPIIQTINKRNQTTTIITPICMGESTTIQATIDSDWNYQWRRNEVNLPGETASSLTVQQAGDYTVVVSSKTKCMKPGTSETLTIDLVGKKPQLDTAGRLCDQSGVVALTSTTDKDVRYSWYKDGQMLPDSLSKNVLRATQPGRYWSALTYVSAGCTINSDTIIITRLPPVVATLLSATGQGRICPGAVLLLKSSGGVRYNWQRDGQPLAGSTTADYKAERAGTYVVTAVDVHGCEGTSASLIVIQLTPATVTLDPVPTVCGADSPAYTLIGSPPGGNYDGPGVQGNLFSRTQAGVGEHRLTYTIKEAPECAGTVAAQTAVVAPVPTISLPDTITVYKGSTLALTPAFTDNPDWFRWTPGRYLTDATLANPTIQAIDEDITYVLKVKNSVGCVTSDTVYIRIGQVWVPDAFSPNADNLNEVWKLFGIEIFTEAIVTIFNRWGEVVYSSNKGYTNPFDGTLNGTWLPTGIYAYTLRLVPELPVLRGRLVLIR